MANAKPVHFEPEVSAKKEIAKLAAAEKVEHVTDQSPTDNLPGVIRPIPQLGITVRVVTK